jgi:hypothetical protein
MDKTDTRFTAFGHIFEKTAKNNKILVFGKVFIIDFTSKNTGKNL